MINKEYFVDRWLIWIIILGIGFLAGLLVASRISGNENVPAVLMTDTKRMCEIDTGIKRDDMIYQITVDECQYMVALARAGSICIIHKQNCNNPQHLKEEKNDFRHKQILEHD